MSEFINGYRCLDCQHCFRKSELFQLLTEEELAIINDKRMEVSFKAGEIIYKQGTPLTHLVIINNGLGKIYLESNKSRNLILNYTKPYKINGGVGVFIDQRHHSSLMAVSDCDACFIEISTFKQALRSNSDFMEAFTQEFAEGIKHTYDQFAVLTQKNMEGRMADSLLYLSEEIYQGDSLEYITKQDLAEITAMTKESAIRVLKQFKDEGLVENGSNKIEILNKAALRQIAQYG